MSWMLAVHSLGFTSNRIVYLCSRRGILSDPLNRFLNIRAVQENGGPRRLVDIIRLVPDISRNYFRSPSRRALFGGISLLGGFYVAQTISLSFGALAVNDVIAAVVCVLLTEYVTKFYYSVRRHGSLPVTMYRIECGFFAVPGLTWKLQ
ncbi:Phosphoenolpyruvate carboxylase-related kinase 1 isoform 1 [Hibiscus syriacus]|uniref:Phosphoenolpyruvate carboxylase-related kinase 1 isoform 1 n=1 Tax=Hibiscus syriacus TaxID=106335 RepID=A0A6A3AZ16_HIBSY|nr:Phosphoenolpyruvate carboxylase-related kinase 1 isoform 1 [Hibiscus syriacus]